MRPYFPILKGKRGEYTAIANLDHVTRSGLVPIVELLPPAPPRSRADRPTRPSASVDQQVNDHVQKVGQCSGDHYRVMIDFTYLPDAPTASRRHPAAAIMEELRSRRVKASPVVRASSSLNLLAALKQADCLDDGVGLRLAPTDLDYPEERIDIILSTLGTTKSDVDVIVDFGLIEDAGSLRQGMTNAALTVIGQSPWRTLSFGATSFPSSLTDLEEGAYRIARLEWQALRNIDENNVGREIGLADYGMRDPGVPVAGGSEPVPNIRYTAEDYWLVLKAKAVDRDLYSTLAFDLVHTQSEWQGPSHCYGCKGFDACSRGKKGKTAEQAICFAMVHHLTCVRQQLASLAADVLDP